MEQLVVDRNNAMTRMHMYFKNIFSIVSKRRGASLIELLLAIGIAAAVLPAILTGFVTSRQGKVQTDSRASALVLLKEASEAVRSVRERGWTSFAINGTYHPEVFGGQWTLESGSETIDGFTRTVVVSDIRRNETGDIVSSGGTIDPSTKQVVTTVSWSTPYASSVSTTQYLTRYLENLSYAQTSLADFNNGTKTQVDVRNTNGGELVIAANTKGQWCQPNLSLTSLDLPGVPNAVWAIEGHVYASTGQTAQASETSFAHVVVANTNPPSGQLAGIIKGYKSNAVFGESSWAYLATSDNSKEIVIIDLNAMDDPTNKIYTQSGYFNTPSNTTDADTIFVHSDRGYMTAGNYLYVFNLSSKTGSRPQIGTRISFANTGDVAGDLYVRTVGSSTYAFVAVQGSTPDELKIINVTNSAQSSQWRVVGGINIEPNNCSALESGQAVFVKPDGTRAYISSVNDTSFKEFFTLNTSNKSSPTLVGGFASNPPCTNGGGYEAGGMDPRQSVVVSLAENRAILVGVDTIADSIDAEEYQVLDLTNEGVPNRCGGMQFNQGIFGIASVKELDGDAYSYIITGDGAAELKIIQGGPDGSYQEEGSYESVTFDAGYSTAFNRYQATSTTPTNTSIKYQFAIVDAINNSCDGVIFSYVGPDGTSNSYYTATESAILTNNDGVGYENPGRCFRYKAILSTTDYNQTPVLSDLLINYSP